MHYCNEMINLIKLVGRQNTPRLHNLVDLHAISASWLSLLLVHPLFRLPRHFSHLMSPPLV